MKDLFKGIYDQFLADSNLVNNFTAMYNTQAPSNAVYPYIVFSLVIGEEDYDSDNYYEDLLIQFNIFSDAKSVETICDLYNYLKGNTNAGEGYDFFQLIVDNYDTLIMKRDTYRLLQVEKIWQYNVTYRVELRYTGTTTTERFYGNLYNLIGM